MNRWLARFWLWANDICWKCGNDIMRPFKIPDFDAEYCRCGNREWADKYHAKRNAALAAARETA